MSTGQTEPADGMRVRNRWGEGRRLREEILEAADRLLGQARNPEEVSLRAIAREAGIAAPSVYKHFRDKSQLMWTLLDGVYDDLAETMRAAAKSAPPGDSWAALRATVDAYCLFATRQRQRYQLIFLIGPVLSDPPAFEEYPHKHVARAWNEVVEAYLADPAVTPAGACGTGLLSGDDVTRLLWTGLHGQFGLGWSLTYEPGYLLDRARDGLLLALFGRT
ncbi:TetR/AcrR family transcriptional regulator [Streptomyces armeniacus]|uniref:TetR/AcrR family transcriptional regulator n=1 Tax=Streptomyces armeniacus TaxID=83291 RepID=A0A345XRD1_9ACTN|nr:TetR/AcrR family transcriptional regulator [Streptomyces armeniacus]AXK34197.1 TetR/AcrR family transcriptional regulator [Streptomyces armeniacus]